ncbi:hypothetical protein U3A58_05865 [Algoriphagus sp. C2-6-M1]|uniref:hypothetical protein n=1 Tax=Algoriphagus persicinus TaxID=3108754 RepID=UPI002B3FD9CF|nr:hypothetical protein [Algoriphagus sp. C2-6-M1]MEB2779915.1 hypothetical protein [Algoriphagus sp. C2-6-M1]
MKREETDKPKWQERIDPDANPLTSFGRDDDFTEELIQGICEINESKSVVPKESVIQSGIRKETQKLKGNVTVKKQRNTRKKRRGIV